ncbi:MAG: hypothetical protein ACXQTR_05660 [Candidatus Methanospirareceae archaeon]
MGGGMETYKVLGLVGFILSIVSLVLPWAEVRAILGLSYQHPGFLTDGVLSFIVLLIAFILVFSRWSSGKAKAALVLSAVGLFFPIEVAAKIPAMAEMIESESGIFFNVGPGLPLMIIACLLMIVAAWMMIKAAPKAE